MYRPGHTLGILCIGHAHHRNCQNRQTAGNELEGGPSVEMGSDGNRNPLGAKCPDDIRPTRRAELV